MPGAEIYARRGNNLQALNQLESAMRLRDDRLGQLIVDPLLDPLRKESRFGVIERELKFPPDLNTLGAHLICSNGQHVGQKRQNEPDRSRRPEVSASACRSLRRARPLTDGGGNSI